VSEAFSNSLTSVCAFFYQAMVTINNFQKFRQIKNPGWTLGWTWAKKEVIWDMLGAQTTEQGDCSRFKGNIPHSCKKIPTVVDLLPSVSYYRQVANCCKGGVVAALGQSAFEASIGQTGNTSKTVRIPQNFTLLAPRARYTCRPANIVPSTVYITPDRRRTTRALSKFLTSKIQFSLSFSTPHWSYNTFSGFLVFPYFLQSAVHNTVFQ
jgi:hypothetical protein